MLALDLFCQMPVVSTLSVVGGVVRALVERERRAQIIGIGLGGFQAAG